jgi:hypothetical protein
MPFVRCTCGATYSVEEWRRLPRIGGIVDVEAEHPPAIGEEPIEPFEMRTCTECHSTISKNVPYEGGSAYPPAGSENA